jgi:hypothetical protein
LNDCFPIRKIWRFHSRRRRRRWARTIADERPLPVRLEYLKWNPAGSLYLRNGFVRTHETDIHVFLERPASRIREQ